APGSTLRVIDAGGRTTVGSLGTLTSSSLELLIQNKDSDGRITSPTLRTLAESDVREIRYERRDPVWNGALIGFGIGALPAIIYIVGSQHGSDPLHDASTGAQIILIPGAISAGIGALVDGVFYEHRTVYRSPKAHASRLRVAPVVSPSA